MSLSARLASRGTLATLVLLAACGGDDKAGPSGNNLSAQQRTAINNLLNNDEVMEALYQGTDGASYAASFLPFMGASVQGAGTIQVAESEGGAPSGEYTAFGMQIPMSVKVTQAQEIRMVWTGVIAVKNLTSPTDVIVVGVVDPATSNAPNSIPATPIQQDNGNARYATAGYIAFNGNQARPWNGTSGSVTVSGLSFSGGTNCAGTNLNPIFKACNYAAGTVSGSFQFSARELGGSGVRTIPATSFSVPATRMTVSLDYTSFGLPFAR